jgi:hypothetical protein
MSRYMQFVPIGLSLVLAGALSAEESQPVVFEDITDAAGLTPSI